MQLRYKSRTFLVLITVVCLVTGYVALRGYWLLRRLEVDGNKATWHALLSFNGLDPERSGFRGKPIGVWRTSDSHNSVTWLLAKQHVLTAVSGNGRIRDFGGITCYGSPKAVWKGVTQTETAASYWFAMRRIAITTITCYLCLFKATVEPDA